MNECWIRIINEKESGLIQFHQSSNLTSVPIYSTLYERTQQVKTFYKPVVDGMVGRTVSGQFGSEIKQAVHSRGYRESCTFYRYITSFVKACSRIVFCRTS